MKASKIGPAFLGSFAKATLVSGARASVRAARGDSRAHADGMTEQATPAQMASATRASERNLIEHGRSFGEKFGKDWCTNLAGLLAYNFLGAFFPLLLGILALGALFLPVGLVREIGTGLNGAIPSAANGTNGLNIDFNNVLENFKNASGITAIVSLLVLLWTGSSLFGVMENCFSIIYRTKDRDFVWQKLMSVAMILIFAVLTPMAFMASSISGSYQQLSKSLGDVPGLGVLFSIGGFVIGAIFGFVLFLLIYIVVPNVKIGWRHAWRGAIVAGVLFEAASLAFPVYTTHFAGKSQFGAVAGLLAVLTLWFWVVSLILLVGAEVNSYFGLGQRATSDDLAGVVHGLKVHAEARRGMDVATPQAQRRIMEDVQPTGEKKRGAKYHSA